MNEHKLFYQDPVQTPVMLPHVSDTPILEKDILCTYLNVKHGTRIKDLKGNSILHGVFELESNFCKEYHCQFYPLKKKMERLVLS